MRRYGISQKPLMRLLDQNGINHSRGNLRAYKYQFPEGLYLPELEDEIQEKIKQLKDGDTKRKYFVDHNFFDVIDTEEKAYILGFFYADGCNHWRDHSITMVLEEKDGYMLKKINEIMHNEHPISFKDMSNKHDFGYNYKDQYNLILNSFRISTILDMRGMYPNKSLILTFPRWLNPSLYNHFLRGVYDGDGSVYMRHKKSGGTAVNLTITSTENFCKGVMDICAKYLNINPHIYDSSCHNGITKVFTLSGNIVTKKFLDWLYKDATIYLQRKYDRYK